MKLNQCVDNLKKLIEELKSKYSSPPTAEERETLYSLGVAIECIKTQVPCTHCISEKCDTCFYKTEKDIIMRGRE